MSYVMLEDDSGSMELIAFQRALDSGGAYLKENAALFIRGRISVRDEKEPQLMVDSIRPLEEAESAAAYQEPQPRERAARGGYAPRPEPAPAPQQSEEKKLYLRLGSREDPVLRHIELLLTMFPGNQQLVIWCEKEKKRIGARCLIHEGLLLELRELLGEENVVLK